MAQDQDMTSHTGLLWRFIADMATQGLAPLPSRVMMATGTNHLQSAKVRVNFITFKLWVDLAKEGKNIETRKTNGVFGWTGFCKQPRTPYKVRLLGSKARYLDGEEATFYCDGNYDLFGNERIRCVGKNWDSSVPVCKGRLVLESAVIVKIWSYLYVQYLCIVWQRQTFAHRCIARTLKLTYGF